MNVLAGICGLGGVVSLIYILSHMNNEVLGNVKPFPRFLGLVVLVVTQAQITFGVIWFLRANTVSVKIRWSNELIIYALFTALFFWMTVVISSKLAHKSRQDASTTKKRIVDISVVNQAA